VVVHAVNWVTESVAKVVFDAQGHASTNTFTVPLKVDVQVTVDCNPQPSSL
jgi:hypothetical protein